MAYLLSSSCFDYDLKDYNELFTEKLDLLIKINESEIVSWKGKHKTAVKNWVFIPALINLQFRSGSQLEENSLRQFGLENSTRDKEKNAGNMRQVFDKRLINMCKNRAIKYQHLARFFILLRVLTSLLMLSIIILDKYPSIIYGMSILLKKYFKNIQITEISDVKNIPHFVDTEIPNLIIIGINDTSSEKDFNIYFEVRKYYPLTPIIIYDEIIYEFQTLPYLEFGIEGYLLKQNSTSELLRSIQIVLSGKRYICNDVLQSLFNRFLLEESPDARKQLLLNLRNPS